MFRIGASSEATRVNSENFVESLLQSPCPQDPYQIMDQSPRDEVLKWKQVFVMHQPLKGPLRLEHPMVLVPVRRRTVQNVLAILKGMVKP